MSAPAIPHKEGSVSLPCVCCGSDDPVSHYDGDLDGMVCERCGDLLIRADAWLKHARVRGCTHLYHNRAERREAA